MPHILKQTLSILERRERRRFYCLSLLDVIISVLDIASLAALLWMVNLYLSPGHDAAQFRPLRLRGQHPLWPIGIFFLLFALKNIAAWLISRSWHSFTSEIAVRLSRENLVCYQQSDFIAFTQTDSSVHIRKIHVLPLEFCQYVLSGIPQLVTQGCLVLVAVVGIIIFDARLFLLLMGVLLPPAVLIFYLIRSRLASLKRDMRDGHEKSFQYLLDALKGFVESKVHGRNRFFLDRFVYSRQKYMQAVFNSLSWQALPTRVIEILAILGLFILIAVNQSASGTEPGLLLRIGAFIGAAYKIIPGIVKIINLSGQVFAYGYTATELSDRSTNVCGPTTPIRRISSIAMEKICFNVDGRPLLTDLSFSLQKGDILGITGESGKGKTTILNILLGFTQPLKGQITVNEKAAAPLELQRYWRQIAYVPQQTFLFHDTLRRNITMEEQPASLQKLQDALQATGIAETPDELDKDGRKAISENGRNISGGQGQRIAFARALYRDADLVLLDEAFNELDEFAEQTMLELVHQLALDGKIVILVSHNRRCLHFCNKILSLDGQKEIISYPNAGISRN